MGLAINYALWLDGHQSAGCVRALVGRARAFALEYEVGAVTPLICVDPDFIMGYRWLRLRHAKDDEPTHAQVPPQTGYVFAVTPGAGCEPLLLGLCRYPAVVKHGGRVLRTRAERGWRLQGACKTQYASVQGWENFLRCHSLAIELLKFWRTLGVQIRIRDEGGYWPLGSEERLRAKLAQMNRIVAATAGALKDLRQKNGTPLLTGAPILAHPRFEHLEHEGLQEYGGKVEEAARAVRSSVRTGDAPCGPPKSVDDAR